MFNFHDNSDFFNFYYGFFNSNFSIILCENSLIIFISKLSGRDGAISLNKECLLTVAAAPTTSKLASGRGIKLQSSSSPMSAADMLNPEAGMLSKDEEVSSVEPNSKDLEPVIETKSETIISEEITKEEPIVKEEVIEDATNDASLEVPAVTEEEKDEVETIEPTIEEAVVPSEPIVNDEPEVEKQEVVVEEVVEETAQEEVKTSEPVEETEEETVEETVPSEEPKMETEKVEKVETTESESTEPEVEE